MRMVGTSSSCCDDVNVVVLNPGFVDFIPVTTVVNFLQIDMSFLQSEMNFLQSEMNFPECIDILLVDDEIALEPDEQFRVHISLEDTLPGLVLDHSKSSTIVNIVDNDGMLCVCACVYVHL